MGESADSGRLSRRSLAALGLAASAAAILSYLAGLALFHQAPITTDENSYLLQAHNFADGRIAREMPPFPRAFAHRMIIVDPDAGWLSRYPPLHALWLVPGVWMGNPHLMSALAAGLSVFFMGLAVVALGGRVWVPCALALCSPWFLCMHGTLLSHTSGLVCASLMLFAYVRWRQTGRLRAASVAGLAWAALCMNRSYTALCLCIPFAVDALVMLARQRDRRCLMGVLAFAGCAASGMCGLLFYNWLAVGDPMTMTFLYYDPSEGLGFGQRHTSGMPIDHTPAAGVASLWANVRSLDTWLIGAPGALWVGLALIAFGWSWSSSSWLLGAMLCVWFGYVAFWYPGIRIAGPVYYMETMPFLVAGIALGVRRVEACLAARGLPRAIMAAAAVCVMAAAGARHMSVQVRERSPDFAERRQLRDTIDAAPPRSLVLVSSGAHSDYVRLNARGLESDPLVLQVVSGQTRTMVEHFADRQAFRLKRTPEPRLRPYRPKRSAPSEGGG